MNKNLINKIYIYGIPFSRSPLKLIHFWRCFFLSTRKVRKIAFCRILQNDRHSEKDFCNKK